MALSLNTNAAIQPVYVVDATGAAVAAGSATGVKSTVAAPTYVEGVATNPLSTDLTGALRVVGSTSSTVKSTAAAPSYTEGATGNPMSADLKGRLRTAIQTSTGADVDFSADTYVLCPASATTTIQTTAGATGDILDGILIIPGTAAAGIVQLKDASGGTPFTIFAGGGTTALPTLAPFFVPLGAASKAGAWFVITNANVTAIAVGKFS